MTAALADEPDDTHAQLAAAFARMAEAFRTIAVAMRAAWDHIARALRSWQPMLRRLARQMARYSRGSYASPRPLTIDGHAYTRRRRARQRRTA